MYRSTARAVFFSVILAATILTLSPIARAEGEKCSDILNNSTFVKGSSEINVRWIDQQLAKMKTEPTPEQKLILQAAQTQGLSSLTLNREIIQNHNENYTNIIAIPKVTNQYQSGRCWLFASLNMLRSKLLVEGLVDRSFEFSENYLYFFAMLEKANTALTLTQQAVRKFGNDRGKLLNAINNGTQWVAGDGGTHQWFNFLVQKYGLVPKSAMREASGSFNSGILNADLQKKLMLATEQMRQVVQGAGSDAQIDRALRSIRESALQDVMAILVANLGVPPAEFSFRMQARPRQAQKGSPLVVTDTQVLEFTPQSFAHEFVKYDPSEYVTLFYNPRFPYGQRYEVSGSAMAIEKQPNPEFSYTGLNLPMDRIEQLIMKSIDAGQALYFEADVLNSADFSPASPVKPYSGILHPKLYNNDPVYGFSGSRSLYPARAILDFYRLISANHAMSIRGYDRPDPKAPPIKYLVENSWGEKVGDGGMLHMYREWLHQNVFGVVVRRSMLSQDEQAALLRAPKPVPTSEW